MIFPVRHTISVNPPDRAAVVLTTDTMITIRQPTDSEILSMLRAVADMPFSYDAVGCLTRATPTGFKRDVAVFALGTGEAAWEAAKTAIRKWVIFPSDLVSTVRLSDEVVSGTVLAVVCHTAGVWVVCPTRIISVTDGYADGAHRFGFTYGTLPGHVESGEERFQVEWDETTGSVTYHIEAVSRPNHPLCWLSYPYARLMQRRFRERSGAAISKFVENNVRRQSTRSRTAPSGTGLPVNPFSALG